MFWVICGAVPAGKGLTPFLTTVQHSSTVPTAWSHGHCCKHPWKAARLPNNKQNLIKKEKKKKITVTLHGYMEMAINFLDTFLWAGNVVSQLPRSCRGMNGSQERSTVITLQVSAQSRHCGRWPQLNNQQQHWPLAPSSGVCCSQNIQFPFLTNGGYFFFLKWVESDK